MIHYAQPETVFDFALKVLRCGEIEEKCRLTELFVENWQRKLLTLENSSPPMAIEQPGCPCKPDLVHPSKLSKRSLHTKKGRLVLMHAIAHIEFNAINLACDAVYRFRGLPEAYYADWIAIAADEARHFNMVCEYLHSRSVSYGDFPAHNGLWDIATRTADDILLRMALVPRVMEARGLDVTPGMIAGFREAADNEAAALLQIIYEEEIGHVATGSRWFKIICKMRGFDPVNHFCDLIRDSHRYLSRASRGPFNIVARRKAGFDQREIAFLQNGELP